MGNSVSTKATSLFRIRPPSILDRVLIGSQPFTLGCTSYGQLGTSTSSSDYCAQYNSFEIQSDTENSQLVAFLVFNYVDGFYACGSGQRRSWPMVRPGYSVLLSTCTQFPFKKNVFKAFVRSENWAMLHSSSFISRNKVHQRTLVLQLELECLGESTTKPCQ